MRRLRCALTVVSTLAVAASHAGAQNLPTGPAVERALHDTTLVTQIPGRWVAGRPAAHARLTTAERSAMFATLGQIAGLWRASLGTLPGVEADVSENAEWFRIPGGAYVAGGDVKVLLWPYSVRNGKLALYDNAARALFWMNQSVCVGPTTGAGDSGFILAPRLTGSFHGFPMLDSVVVVTHRTQPPCVPVTRGEYLEAYLRKLIADRAHDDSAWRADAPTREKSLADAARANPALAASVRAQMAQMTSSADSARTAVQRLFSDALARMSPAERASPAYVSESGCQSDAQDPSACFVDPRAPHARAVVRENPAFFDTTRPDAPQLITLSLGEVIGGRGRAPYPTQVMEAALDRLDWAALSALVR